MYGIDHYKKKKNKHIIVKDIILIYIIAVVFVLLFNSMILQAYKVPSDSMFPAIDEGTCVLTNKFAYGPKYPMTDIRIFDGSGRVHRGDIVVFMSNEYFDRGIMFRSFSSFLYTLTFSIVDMSRFQRSYESNIYIKRVVGIPGDRISYKLVNDKVVVYINGIEEKKMINIDYRLIDETEENSPLLSNMILQNETVLKDGEFYVLGDNRISSSDSRIYGPVRSKQIIGKAVLKYWPLRNSGAVR